VIDGDTVELFNGTVLRYTAITAPEEGENFAEEATKLNQSLLKAKKLNLNMIITLQTNLEEYLHIQL